MEKIRLGKTNLMVSRLGFGGIPIQRDSEDDAIAVVRKCLELGINYLDTANAYTTSEGHIGKAISGRREGLIIATKTAAREGDIVESHLKLSLQQLGVESIDLYQLHSVSNFDTLDIILAPDGPMAVLEKAKRAGQIKHIGVTSHQIDVAKELVKSGRFETIMFPFNFITCEAADELIPLARKHDVGFIAMKPLAGGILDNVNIAFKYLLQYSDVVPIVGIQKAREIEEIVKVLEGSWRMTEAELKEMQRLKEELGTKFCRRCDYCQPCTAEIPISLVLDTKSLIKKLPPQGVFSGHFAVELEKAANCNECGDCEERCPYHLPIREMIKEYAGLYETEKRKYQDQITSR